MSEPPKLLPTMITEAPDEEPLDDWELLLAGLPNDLIGKVDVQALLDGKVTIPGIDPQAIIEEERQRGQD